ncbi:AAA family ATPase [Pectobacterium odoriferum]|uniref:ATP-dependent nuclease n=1 Tax=Pectobacterium odoriferum TaxID=78398 RepID=UPI0032ECB93A
MRNAKVNDTWRHVNEIDKYGTRINSVEITGLSGFENIKIDLRSAITAICGKNGVGKTTILKLIYQAIKKPKEPLSITRFGSYDFHVDISHDKNNILINKEVDSSITNIYYLEPSQECSKILEYLHKTKNIDEMIEGEGENISFNEERTKSQIEHILGKKYKRVVFREIADAIESDYVFPYFEIELENGVVYSNTSMGMGEFAVFYILWFIRSCERNSIIFIEEPENFISANTQKYLMDKIAEQSNSNKLWIMLSTHSEHILSRISIDNTKVLQKRVSDITHLIEPKHREKYLTALGLTPQLDGIIFVEDIFSASFTNYLLSTLAPAFLKSYKILPIRCDSNIEKIASHYEPLRKSPINYIGIFDADQKDKVSRYLDKEIYISALPGKNPSPPEILVWETLVDNVSNIAIALEVDQDSLQEAIVDNNTVNYHDRYLNVSKQMSVPIDALLQSIFSAWMKNQENKKLAELFVFSIINHDKSHISIMEFHSEGGIKVVVDNEEVHIAENDIIYDNKKPLVNGMTLSFQLFFNSKSYIAKITAD